MKVLLCLIHTVILLVRACYCVTEDVKAAEQTKIDADRIVFVIISQSDSLHSQVGEEAERQLRTQAAQLNWPDVHVFLTHVYWPDEIGIWTVFPLFDKLLKKKFVAKLNNPEWLVICEEGTRINLKKLISILHSHDHEKDWFFGKALRDSEATIIHHFAFHDSPTSFAYPDFAAGVVFSWSLFTKLRNRSDFKTFISELNFSIDPQHELALFVWDNGNGVALTHVDALCTEEDEQCATSYVLGKIPICVKPAHLTDIFFAVKTCKKYEERVTVLLETWATSELDLAFFGDVANDTHGQNIVNLKVENTERGHCGKTMGILHYVASNQRLKSKSWLVITDDDTLLSVSRLRNHLSCYNPTEKLAIGQRYGYRTASSEGYDYMTGGAGYIRTQPNAHATISHSIVSMVLSMNTVRHIVESGLCKCPTADTPDDMYLGICLQKLKIPVIHSPYFHQARPIDYSADLLQHQEPVTFHKFWMIEPVKIYKDWLSGEFSTLSSAVHEHNEL